MAATRSSSDNLETVIDALFEAGCGDAAIGRIDGVQYVDFDREAPSLDEAILSAVADLERVDGVDVVRIADAGLVSMADIAARIRRTREGVRLLITGARGPGGFPPPVTDPRSRYRLWRWSDVAHWCMNRSARTWPTSTGCLQRRPRSSSPPTPPLSTGSSQA